MSLASLPSRVSVTVPLGLPEVAGGPLNVGIVWDAENRLVEVKQGATTLASFAYDGRGRRQQKTAGGVTYTYISDRSSLLEERVSTGQTLRYVEGRWIDQHLAMQEGGAVTYYLADHLGSVVQATNSAGTVTLARKYDPWGNMLAGASSAGWAYTGRRWDSEIQLYYYRARYYDPNLGRFLSEDPIKLLGGLNLYRYVLNSPIMLIDPFGLRVPINLFDPAQNATNPQGHTVNFHNAAERSATDPTTVEMAGHGVRPAEGHPATHVADRDGNWMTPHQASERVKNDEAWHPGKPVRLLICNSGTGPNSMGQQMADELCVEVEACDGNVDWNDMWTTDKKYTCPDMKRFPHHCPAEPAR